jgi:iron complex outermembrane receptor protein
MRRVIFALLLPVVGMFTSQAQFVFSGSVKTDQNVPLEGAVVLVEGVATSALSGNNGTFRVQEIPKGTFKVMVSYLGYDTFSESIDFSGNISRDIVLKESVTRFEEVIVSAVRAQYNTPTTFSTLRKKDIEKIALGQDATYLLAMEPSVVSTSDAGTGIGYTSMRIRGVESSKINVTINGIPLNDPESHGVFWVDVPDIATSSQSIQVQRGVGTSTNGSGAFGASINMQTDNISQNPFFEYSGAAGSFNTLKNSVHFGSGLINKHWFFEGKASSVNSDGYIDRGWSNLKSYFAQTGYYSDKTIIKLIGFGGWEETYQAWYGIDSATLYNPDFGRKYNPAGAYTDNLGNQKFFDNMIDHYQQDHLQLHILHKFNQNLSFNAALHYTYGRGYYQDYVPSSWGMDLNYFGLPNGYYGKDSTLNPNGSYSTFYHDTLSITDVIHRLWLDNQFYGTVWGLTYNLNKLTLIWGGAVNKYGNAKHFGQVMWGQYFFEGTTGKHYYDNEAEKTDWNTYLKVNYQIIDPLSLFVDMQIRQISYKAWGHNKEYTPADVILNINKKYSFFNPKAGLLYNLNKNTNFYTSFAIAHREPTRGDFLDSETGEEPKPESLYDFELGARHNENNMYAEASAFNMQYLDQLILTGELNGVGSPIRKNVGKSYRRGIEIVGGYIPVHYIRLDGNFTFSVNKTEYSEFISGTNFNKQYHDIAMSPKTVAAVKITLIPLTNLEAAIQLKHVGKQYLDNSQSYYRKLDEYNIIDFLMSYSKMIEGTGLISINLKINNIFNTMYISNGRVSGGIPYYFPQAGINFLAGASMRF